MQRDVSLPALLALIRPFTCVHPCVDEKSARAGEGFSTLAAQERFVPFVQSHVVRQRARLVEFLTADLTAVSTLPGVNSHVSFQHLRTRKPFAAIGASVRLHCSVGLVVLLQATLCLESLVAFVALVNLLGCRVFRFLMVS